ncbi:hypothetical protein JX266_011103 [Neoarthrinium moseri]|nr:hypothetical protein JX266_011103 [Neoarthrinium moseri]
MTQSGKKTAIKQRIDPQSAALAGIGSWTSEDMVKTKKVDELGIKAMVSKKRNESKKPPKAAGPKMSPMDRWTHEGQEEGPWSGLG